MPYSLELGKSYLHQVMPRSTPVLLFASYSRDGNVSLLVTRLVHCFGFISINVGQGTLTFGTGPFPSQTYTNFYILAISKLFSTLVCNQVLAKLMTFPSA